MNRATLGTAESVFAVLKAEIGGIVGYVQRKDIIIDEQKVGAELTGRLMVDVIEEKDNYSLVEVEINPGERKRLKVDRKTNLIVPLKESSRYFI